MEKKIIHELMVIIKSLNPNSELSSIIGSYGDTMSDEDVLRLLKDYNENGSAFRDIIATH